MSIRTAIILSLGLNVVLLAAACWLAQPAPAPRLQSRVMRAITHRAPEAESAESGRVHSPPTATAARFHWGMIESKDYPAYVANLRAIACPQSTLRDIIYADVNDLFVRKRQALLEPFERRFWDLLANDKTHGNEWLGIYDALKEEKTKLLEELLGRDREPMAPQRRPSNPEAQLGFLSEEKQERIGQILSKYIQLRRDMDPPSGQPTGPDLRERSRALLQQQEAELKQLLTEQEYDEYKLRRSPAARLVQNLYGFAPTEEESRAITRLKMEIEEALRKPDSARALDKQAMLEARQQAQEKLDEQVKGLLGEDRFGEFKRASDPRFQEICRVARRYDLSQAVAVRVYEIRDAAEHAAGGLRQDPGLSEDQRQTALEMIAQETEGAIAQNLGASGLKTYKRYGGNWLDTMAELPDEDDVAAEGEGRN